MKSMNELFNSEAKTPTGFQRKLSAKLAGKKGVNDPDALAAWIKRNKQNEAGEPDDEFEADTPKKLKPEQEEVVQAALDEIRAVLEKLVTASEEAEGEDDSDVADDAE